MKKKTEPFTNAFLDKLEPAQPGSRYVIYDAKQPKLALRVSDHGVKTFIVSMKHKGKSIKITLGHYPEMSIYLARKGAINKLAEINETGSYTSKSKKTFKELYESFIQDFPKKDTRHYKSYEQDIPRFFGNWFDCKIWDITEDDLRAKIKEIKNTYNNDNSTDFQKNYTMDSQVFHCFQKIRAMFYYAISKKWIDQNPVRLKELGIGIPEGRNRFLKSEETRCFFAALNKLPLLPRTFFLLLLYTGARKSNVLDMKWSDIYFDMNGSSLWIIPGSKTKNGKEHVVPLISQAENILKELQKTKSSEWVFPNPKDSSKHYVCMKKHWQKLLEESGIEDLRLHDLRRTMGSWQAINGSSLSIIGQSLGHKSTKSTEIYARLITAPVQESMQKAIDSLEKTGK